MEYYNVCRNHHYSLMRFAKDTFKTIENHVSDFIENKGTSVIMYSRLRASLCINLSLLDQMKYGSRYFKQRHSNLSRALSELDKYFQSLIKEENNNE